jgi:Holliday junction DNA helicase RuvA
VIGHLRGVIIRKQPPQIVLDVHGVGYELDAPMSTFYALPATGETVSVFTHLLVREDAHALFGFASEAERSLFRSLIRISGVGARLALAILSGMSVDLFVQCVRNGDSGALTRLPGIGKKTAERLLVEMRDRLSGWEGTESVAAAGGSSPGDGASGPVADAVHALVALGYKPQEAARMVRAVEPRDRSAEVIIREALRGAVK